MKTIKKIVIYGTKEDPRARVYSTDVDIVYRENCFDNGSVKEAINRLLEQRGLDENSLKKLIDNETIIFENNESLAAVKVKYDRKMTEEAANNYYHEAETIDPVSYDPQIEDPELEDEVEKIIDEEFDNIERKNNQTAVNFLIGATIFATAATLIYSISSCNLKTKTGTMTSSNITSISTETDDYTDTSIVNINSANTNITNDEYDNYTFAQLLDVTSNEFQKSSMINLSSTINGFNGVFADAYVEKGNDIRAALTIDEVSSLQHAYNNYSKKEIKSYFNGSEINAIDLSNDYKDASLELMDAYVIENSKNPVDMSILIDNSEGKDFYNKYHDLFLRAKEATGNERIKLINEFYKAVRKDFPITKDVRTTGTMHSDERKSIKDYKLSVAPIVAAADIIFANDKVDRLSKEEIAFFNDIGLCNYADDKFEKIETIMLSSEEDNTNPLWEQYRNAIIDVLLNRNQYVTDNEHRELANLRLFKKIVNPSYDDTNTASSNNTYVKKKTWTDKKIVRKTKTTKKSVSDKDVPADAKKKAKDDVDKKIKDDNDAAKKKGIKDANDNAKKMQDDADKDGDDIKKKIDDDDKKRQNKIDDANKKIDNGDKVNQTDLGDDVNVDDPYVDDNGDIDNSVKNITTDPSGADQDLPDPDDTDDDFNKRTQSDDTTQTTNDDDSKQTTATSSDDKSSDNGDYYTRYDKKYTSYDADGNPISEEKLVELYIEILAQEASREIEKVYVK